MSELTTLKTDAITVHSNPRKLFAGIDELADSIKQHGVLEPLVVHRRGDVYELIAGERRLRASKQAGLEQVPVQILDELSDSELAEIKLVENLQRQDLSPLEESEAFQEYLKATGSSKKELADKLGKTAWYVERRMSLSKLSAGASKALQDGDILLGHAAILSELTKTQQNELVSLIIEHEWSVDSLADQLRWHNKIDWERAYENAEDILPKQAEAQISLEDLGKDLETQRRQAQARQLESFKKELNEYVNAERKRLRDAGVAVFPSEEALIRKYPHVKSKWSTHVDYDYRVSRPSLEMLQDQEHFAVYVDITSSGYLTTQCVQIKEEKQTKKDEKKHEPTEEEKRQAEELLKKRRAQRLAGRVEEHKLSWLRQHAPKHLKPGSIPTLAATATQLWKSMAAMGGWHWRSDEDELAAAADQVEELLGLDADMYPDEQTLLKQSEETLHKVICVITQALASREQAEWLDTIGQAAGMSYEDEWRVTQEYVGFYTKGQAVRLAEELGISKKRREEISKMKKSEMVQAIVKDAKPGKLPIAFQEAGQ